MFLTVTLNPALDKTLRVDHNSPQDTLRATEVVDLAGGKGVNVARAIQALGGRTRALLPLAGHSGAHLADLARAEGIEVAGVPVTGQTRTAITIRDADTGKYWHYLEPGPRLHEQDLTRLREGFLWAMEGCHTVAVSGSLPSPSAAALLPWMVRAGRERGLRVALDSFGPQNRPALEAGPWLAKPNLYEWQTTFDEELETDVQRWRALERLATWGIEIGVLSLGAEGALALARGERFRIKSPQVVELNDLGGGDSMVAGICWAAAEGYGLREILAWGAACGAANAEVWDPGGIVRARVEELLPIVEIGPG
ncbi:MAG: phosphofructokinase [Armatimonadetes bacterium]|nr:phosphofructokinase [Armatimonadota bacterium]